MILSRNCVDCGARPDELDSTRPIILRGDAFVKALDDLVRPAPRREGDHDDADDAEPEIDSAIAVAVKEWWMSNPPPGFCELTFDTYDNSGHVETGDFMGVRGEWAPLFAHIADLQPDNFTDVPLVTHIVSVTPA